MHPEKIAEGDKEEAYSLRDQALGMRQKICKEEHRKDSN
jgi:hypothetical protein